MRVERASLRRLGVAFAATVVHLVAALAAPTFLGQESSSYRHERLTLAHEHLRALNADIEALTEQYDAFVRTRQEVTHSYVGYEIPITGLRARVDRALEQLEVLMARQGHLLEIVAIEELIVRRDRLERYRDQARFAFADSYDRAAKAQGRSEEP